MQTQLSIKVAGVAIIKKFVLYHAVLVMFNTNDNVYTHHARVTNIKRPTNCVTHTTVKIINLLPKVVQLLSMQQKEMNFAIFHFYYMVQHTILA